MKKIVILGCENSHANSFLNFIRDNPKYSDVEVLGVYSDDAPAAQKLADEYGVKIMSAYDEAVGQVDGVIVTARHGDLHYEYAKPYIESGIPMFIDKPVTIKEDEALEFMRVLKEKGIQAVGGSSLKHDKGVKALKKERLEDADGKTLGGFVRAPIDMASVYGGFYFYAPHLVEVVSEVFGRFPLSVEAKAKGDLVSVKFNYEEYSVDGMFTERNYLYYACRSAEKSVKGMLLECNDDNNWFRCEFDEFYEVLMGGESKVSYTDLISSVFVMNAIERSLKSGKEEAVKTYTV